MEDMEKKDREWWISSICTKKEENRLIFSVSLLNQSKTKIIKKNVNLGSPYGSGHQEFHTRHLGTPGVLEKSPGVPVLIKELCSSFDQKVVDSTTNGRRESKRVLIYHLKRSQMYFTL